MGSNPTLSAKMFQHTQIITKFQNQCMRRTQQKFRQTAVILTPVARADFGKAASVQACVYMQPPLLPGRPESCGHLLIDRRRLHELFSARKIRARTRTRGKKGPGSPLVPSNRAARYLCGDAPARW